MTSETFVAELDQEISRCRQNVDLSVKNWGEIKAEQPSIDDTVVVTALATHAISMAEVDSIPSVEYLAMHLAVAIKMIYEERNRR